MNWRAGRSQVLPVSMLLLWLGGYALAQDAYLARWKALRAGQPEGIAFQISTAKGEFYQGELIPL